MTTKRGQARTFSEDELTSLLIKVTDAQAQKRSRQPAEVMRVAFMLSFYAGLRVQEIAGLQWDINIFDGDSFRYADQPVYDEEGRVVRFSRGKNAGQIQTRRVESLYIHQDIGKYGKARTIPLHPDLRDALMALRNLQIEGVFVIPSAKDGAATTLTRRAHALKMRINRLYNELGLERGSSHSGRRSFITRAAQRAEAFNNSLVDVRDMAGHASLTTTQHYVDPSARQGDLVEAIW